MFSAPETFGAFDGEGVSADALDLGAHAVEHVAETLNVRFASGVTDDSDTLSDGGGHDGVFGGGNGSFIEEDLGADEFRGSEMDNPVDDFDVGAEGGESEDMGVEAATTDDITAGRGEGTGMHPSDESAGEEDGRA